MFSRTIIVGRLGKDPEKRFTPDGKAITTFSVAVDAGDKTAWFRVAAWDKLADLCETYLSKGKLVLVEGVLSFDPATGSPRIWTDKEGNARTSFEISAREVKFLSPKDENEGEF